ncbi:MAG TPA: GNAT family N-acetyltransferase [Stellaceae bacterium]
MGRPLVSDMAEISENLVLKPLRPEDAEAVRIVTDHPAITTVISFLHPPFSVEDAEALIRRNESGNTFFLGMWRRSDDALVGISCVFLHGDDDAELGQWVGAAHHGSGYGTEAAAALTRMAGRIMPKRRIYAECRPENRTSWKILEKVGYRADGPGKKPGFGMLVYEKPGAAS